MCNVPIQLDNTEYFTDHAKKQKLAIREEVWDENLVAMLIRSYDTYRNQSTARRRLMSLVGSPTEVRTINMVISPALGILAAPILAQVAVTL